MDTLHLVLFAVAAAVMEFVDSGLGMGYGTVLTPVILAVCGDIIVVPAVLISQAVGGFTASVFHHRQKNADLRPKTLRWWAVREGWRENGLRGAVNRVLTTDLKIVAAIIFLGLIAAVIGSVVSTRFPHFLKWYITIMITGIGILLLAGRVFTFSWLKLMAVGLFASFNKGLSGGGFGPIATGGQVVIGNAQRSSIGCTTLAEAPICIVAYLTFVAQKATGSTPLTIALCIGAAVGGVFGASLTRRLPAKAMKIVLGILLVTLGIIGFVKLLHR